MKEYVRTILDYPVKGIQFRDITTLLQDSKHFEKIPSILKTFQTKYLGNALYQCPLTLHMIQSEIGPPRPQEGEYQPTLTEENAKALGREQATAIVASTTGLNVVPPPVGSGGDGDEGE